MWKLKYIFSGGSHCHFNEWGHSSQNMNLNSFVSCKALVLMLGRALEKIFWSVFRSELAVNCEGNPFTLGTRWTSIRAGIFWESDHLLSLLLSLSFPSDSLQPHGLQHARPPGTISQSLLKLMSIESVMPFHLPAFACQKLTSLCAQVAVRGPADQVRVSLGQESSNFKSQVSEGGTLQFWSRRGPLPPLWPWDVASCTPPCRELLNWIQLWERAELDQQQLSGNGPLSALAPEAASKPQSYLVAHRDAFYLNIFRRWGSSCPLET